MERLEELEEKLKQSERDYEVERLPHGGLSWFKGLPAGSGW